MATETMRTQDDSGRLPTGGGGGDLPAAVQAVPLEIGPFLSHSDMLRFAAQLEAQAGIRRLELMYAGPRTGRFIVYAASAAAVARAIAELSGVRVSAVVSDNVVTAHVHDSMPRAMQVFAPPVAPRRARLAGLLMKALIAIPLLALIPLAVGLAVYFTSSSGSSSPPAVTLPPVTTPTLAPTVPVVVITPPETTATPIATPEPTPAATAEPTPEPTAEPTPEPTAEPTPESTVVVAPAPTPVASSDLYRGSFSGSFGVVTAVNGCSWNTPFTATVDLSLSEGAGGRLTGQATASVTIRYTVATTPPATTCNPGTVTATGSGPAGQSGSLIVGTMRGDRDFELEFSGSRSGSTITGSADIQRIISTASPFGDTHDLRSSSASGVRLSLVN